MNFNFELILFWATVITGVIALIDILFFAPRRKKLEQQKIPMIFDYARSFFPILLIVFLLRSFLYEPFRIPSPSLEPTLLIGDFVLVNKYNYGIRLPVMHTKLAQVNEPKRGDIMVFRWPPNPSVDFIKRVIGLPGDHISYINKELTINGQKIPQEFVQNTKFTDESGEQDVVEKQEDLFGVKHQIYINPSRKDAQDFRDIVVPPNMYFVMGDNRDNSADSRYFGFVPNQNIVGKAILVWLSWDSDKTGLRFNRIGKRIL